MQLAYRILNVFALAGDRLSGNPLCVFEDGSALTDAQMQALARQLNLSETTFILPSSTATARVRIFTPSYEMPFAGHPTLGTAHVVRALGAGADLTLEERAGIVRVTADGDRWTLRAAKSPTTVAPAASHDVLARMVGVSRLGGEPLWVDTGAQQLVVPLASAADVRAAHPDAALIDAHGRQPGGGEGMAYVWARDGVDRAVVRFFFTQNGAVTEDPATGSACANLGGYFVATGAPLPVALTLRQGDAIGRPSELRLRVDADRSIYVSGLVIELGDGTFEL